MSKTKVTGALTEKDYPPNNFGMDVSYDHNMSPFAFEDTGSKIMVTGTLTSKNLSAQLV
jgi:hypothetical protein